MAEKGFGVKKISFVQPSGSPTLTSPNNINLNAVNVAISTDVSIGATCTAYEFRGAISGWEVGNDGISHYSFKGPGFDGGTRYDPDIHLVRGQRYIFHNRTDTSGSYPFRIQSTINGSIGTQYNNGVTNNDGAAPTDIIFDVPHDAPSMLFYQCTSYTSMGGRFIIGNPFSGGVVQTISSTGGYAVTAADAGQIINFTNTSGGNNVTISDTGSTLQPGDEITIINNQNINSGAVNGTGSVSFRVQPPNSNGNSLGTASVVATSFNIREWGLCKILCVSNNLYYVHSHGGNVQ